MSKVTYWFIRMWAPASESSDTDNAHYVTSINPDEGRQQWTVSREFTEAHYFKKQVTAERIVRGVRRITERIKRGWFYEIFRVDETVVGTNVPEKEKKEVA